MESSAPLLTPPIEAHEAARHWRRLIVLLVIAGALCRLSQYLANISFWHDEACLVLNIMNKTPRQLLGALHYDQTAPPLFLLIVKASGLFFGYTEAALRLLPQLASLASLPLFAFLAWRLLSPKAATVAVALLAFSPNFITHASEVKQYSTDVFSSLLLIALAIAAPRPASPAWRLFCLGLLITPLMWLSETALLTFAGISLAFLPRILQKNPRNLLKYLPCHLLPIGSFLLLYHFSMHPQKTGNLFDYWTDHWGLPDYAHPLRLALWPFKGLLQFHNYAYEPWGPLNLALALLGFFLLRSRRKPLLLNVLLFPVAMTVLAALALCYPFGGSRITLFLMPAVLLLVANGLDYLHELPHPRLKQFAWLAPALLLGGGMAQSAYHLVFPRNQSHLRPVVQYVKEHRLPDQPICVTTGISWVEFLCYWRNPDSLTVQTADLNAIGNAQRFWIVFEFDPSQGMKKREAILHQARSFAAQKDQFVIPGGAAFLFQRNLL